ncbi:MAG: nucleoside monophosphate kinase [Saprospiraceae bacterium]
MLLSLDVDEDEIVKRILLRGKTLRAELMIMMRDIIRNRFEVYKNETSPVFDYYAKEDKSVMINVLIDR